MPLFRRSDGALVRNLPTTYRIMPFVMRGRNESALYVDLRCDFTTTRQWISAWNGRFPQERCRIQILFLFAVRRVFSEFPALNRFVSGGRVYQRHVHTASFVVKDSLERDDLSWVAKIPLPDADETFLTYNARLADEFRAARERQVRLDRKIGLLLRLPGFVVRSVMWLRSLLDSWNLLPAFLTRDDPLYTSFFVSNLGSLGVPSAYHHLYEYGTCSLFFVLSAIETETVADRDGTPQRRDILPVLWTIDERVADGVTFARAIRRLQCLLEDPTQLAALPDPTASAAAGDGSIPAVPADKGRG